MLSIHREFKKCPVDQTVWADLTVSAVYGANNNTKYFKNSVEDFYGNLFFCDKSTNNDKIEELIVCV